MTRILITGAAGFIGSHLTERLLADGLTVIGIDDFNDYYEPAIKRANISSSFANARFSIHTQDIRDRKSVFEIFERAKADVVVHLAARAGVRPSMQDPVLYHDVNIIGTQHILDACKTYPVSHIVMASSSSVYGGITEVPFDEGMDVSQVISPYAATKRMNELMAHVYHHNYGLKTTLLRFFTAYGPRQRPDMAIHKFTRLISEGKPVPMFGDGTTRRDYTYVDDIVDGVYRAIERPFGYEIFNLGESRTVTLHELIETIGRHLGKEPRIDSHPMEPGDVLVTYADISKAKRLLGYNPQYPLDEGIKRFVAWYHDPARPMRTP